MTTPAGSSTVKVEFRATLPYRLTSLLALLAFAPDFEGLDSHLSAFHGQMDAGIRRDMEIFFLPLAEGLIAMRLVREDPAFDDFASLMGWLARTQPDDLRSAAVSLLDSLEAPVAKQRSSSQPVNSAHVLDDEAALHSFLLASPDPWAERIRESTASLQEMIRLLTSPVEAIARLMFLITRFWESHGRDLLEGCARICLRSIEYHQDQIYTGTPAEILGMVAGQRVTCDESQQRLEKVSRLVFIPSCFVGARTMLSTPPANDSTMLVTFNARSSGVGVGDQAEFIGQVFSPLKALADETRLHVVTLIGERELYARQIVDQLKQSQSTISRHLSLLVTSGILSVRKEGGMNFYRINKPSMERFIELLQSMSGERT